MTTKLTSIGMVYVLFVCLFIGLICSDRHGTAAPCNDVFNETLSSCCPLKYLTFCCPRLTEPCNDTATVPTPDSVQNKNLPGRGRHTGWKKPYCMRPLNSTACEAGFYFNSVSIQVDPCPDGFYCPQNLLCIIPCPKGAYCMKDSLINSTDNSPPLCREGEKCCSPSQSVPFYDGRLNKLLCPGAKRPVACPEGNYCPAVTVKKTCPEGHFCRNGSTEPQKCPLLSICRKGSSAPVSAAAGLLLIVALFLLWILLLYCFNHERAITFYYHYYVVSLFSRGDERKAGSSFRLRMGLKLSLNAISTCAEEYRQRAVAKTHTINIRFEELGLVLKPGGKTVLKDVTGEIKPGEITAVMGPSGSGKTTLLNTLSGKAYYGNRRGRILINNSSVDDLGAYRNITGFVPQDDVMHRLLTVNEVLTYQAHLRLPSSTSEENKKIKVEEVLDLLDLKGVKDTRIGDEEARGISGGQRKRVNIGMELVADPTLLFLDEPTSGLDSTSSLMVVDALKAVAEKARLTVVCVIHQPRYEIFNKFHKVLFLGLGGKTVFQGTVPEAENYFQNLGFEKPLNVNPADFYLDVIGGIYKSNQSQVISLGEEWNQHQSNAGGAEIIEESPGSGINRALDSESDGVGLDNINVNTSEDLIESGRPSEPQKRKMPSFFAQFWTFFRREVSLQFRLARYLLLDQFLVLLAGGTLGALRREAPLDEFFALQTLSSLAIGLTAMLSALRCFGNNRTTFWRESAAGINRVSYFVAVNIAQIPIILITPLIYLSLLYTLVAPRALFKFHYLATLGAQFTCTGVGYAISTIFSPRNSQMAAVTYALICSLVSGSSPSLCTMNGYTVIGPLLYNLSFSRWYLEALFEKEATRYPQVMAPYVHALATVNGYSLDNYYACVLVMVGMGIAYRLLALLFLLLSNRGKQQ